MGSGGRLSRGGNPARATTPTSESERQSSRQSRGLEVKSRGFLKDEFGVSFFIFLLLEPNSQQRRYTPASSHYAHKNTRFPICAA